MPPDPPDHYALLKVHPSASTARIKAAYLRLVFHWHPDRNTAAEAGERTAQLNAAWEVLRDPVRRAAYDRQRRLARPPAASPAAAPKASARPGPVARPAHPARPAAPDPAAAERARRAEAESAREAEARRQRNTEYEQRRKAAESQWRAPPDSGLGWLDRGFVIGHWYRDARHTYRVVDVRDRLVDIYIPDGRIVTLRRDDLWREWQRQIERRHAPNPPRRGTSRRYGVGGPR